MVIVIEGLLIPEVNNSQDKHKVERRNRISKKRQLRDGNQKIRCHLYTKTFDDRAYQE